MVFARDVGGTTGRVFGAEQPPDARPEGALPADQHHNHHDDQDEDDGSNADIHVVDLPPDRVMQTDDGTAL